MPAETVTTTRMTTPTTTKGTPALTLAKGNNNNSLLFSKGLCEENHKSKSPNSRLYQLAERSTPNPRKNNNSSSSPSHLLSFRNVISKSNPPSSSSSSSSVFARRNTSILNSSLSSHSSPNSEKIIQSVRQNPKLYTSFSSKSCSKLTKAFIRSDPLKTNIEHLVVSPTITKSTTNISPSHSPNSSSTLNDVNLNHSSSSSHLIISTGTSPSSSEGVMRNPNNDHHQQNSRGLSIISTPLKALHASFHDKSKLSHAFAPRSKLFSQRDKFSQKSSPKEKSSSSSISYSNNRNSPDFLEYYGNPEINHTQPAQNQQHQLLRNESQLINHNSNRNYSTPDILEDVIGIDTNESNYINLGERRASEDFINRSNNNNNNNSHVHSHHAAVLRGRIPSSSSSSNGKSPPIIPSRKSSTSTTKSAHSHLKNDVQISSNCDMNLTRDQNLASLPSSNLHIHSHNNNNNKNNTTGKDPCFSSSSLSTSSSDTERTLQLQSQQPNANNPMKMSTATPMKTSTSACRAQIISLNASKSSSSSNGDSSNISNYDDEFIDNASTTNNKNTAGVAHLNSNQLLCLPNGKNKNPFHQHHHSTQQQQTMIPTCSHLHQNPSGVNGIASTESGSGGRNSWVNSNYANTQHNGLLYQECHKDDKDSIQPPPIPRRSSTASSTSSSQLVSPRKLLPPPPSTPTRVGGALSTNVTPTSTQSEIKSVSTFKNKSFGVKNNKSIHDDKDVNLLARTGLLRVVGHRHALLPRHNNNNDVNNFNDEQQYLVSNYHHPPQQEERNSSSWCNETEKIIIGLIHDDDADGGCRNGDDKNKNVVDFREHKIDRRKLSMNKIRPEKRFTSLMHSFSFRSDGKSKSGNGCGLEYSYSPLENEDIKDMAQHLKRIHRSRSLPKSFMSGNNKRNNNKDSSLQQPLLPPSLWIRDDSSFETLLEEKRSPTVESSSPVSYEDSSSDVDKMRWQKSSNSSSSSSSTIMAEGHGRPKSFDYSQRKAWMKYYREMEVSSATNLGGSGGNANGPIASSSSCLSKSSQKINKHSISHLHLLPPQSSSSSSGVHGHPNPPSSSSEMGVARRTPEALGLTPSLFQRFSKTFSLRFGSNSSVNKVGHGKKTEKVVTALGIGSSPDLHSRFDGDLQSGKMRKGKSKSTRGEKCQSGDSGIGIDEPHPHHHHTTSRLRRIRSEFIESSTHLHHPIESNNNISSRNSAALGKMSIVEIPNHVWEEEKARQEKQQHRKTVGPISSSSCGYEDASESKLDEDDGFSSGDNNSNNGVGSAEEDTTTTTTIDPILGGRSSSENPYHHYHSLPHKNSRKAKQQQQNQQQQAITPSGRSKSLEDEQELLEKNKDLVVSSEDNSIRGKVIKEIIITEQNYVKTLNDIVQGFLNPCRRRTDLFSGESVQNIYSNIEDILRLHARFLEAMKSRIHPTCISSSNIGQIFTEWADHFNLYSEYCCNNPISMATVRSLMLNQEYTEFFEACRRLQLMDKLPLHGFLLRPIQRICQYHLQLAELLKQTEASHSDYPSVVEALDTMKDVAMKINDTQRKFDSLLDVQRLQNSIEGWEGSDLLNRNSTVLIKGELVKSTPGKRNKEITCFLLNKDLVFCKKDYLKKGGYVLEGRIDLEVGVWLNIDSNEEDEYFGMVHNSWRIYSIDQKTWILFTAPTPSDKRKWISSLEKTNDPQIILDPRMCKMAKLTTLLNSEDNNKPQSQSHYSNNSSNTLPKSSKKSKGKHSSVSNGKIDADAMLIEVSKLKRSIHNGTSAQPNHDRSSKFYV